MAQGERWTPAQREARLNKLVERNRAQHRGAFLYEDADWMRQLYWDQKLSMREIAIEAHCGERTVARWMQTHRIPTEPGRLGLRSRRGPDNPHWKGGLPVCMDCGKTCSRGRSRCMSCYQQFKRGQNGSNWRGDDVEYTGMHYRLIAQRGQPSSHKCAHCPSPAREWAYDHSDPDERRNKVGRDEGPFSVDLDRYLPLCVRCHRKFDNGRPGVRGRAR